MLVCALLVHIAHETAGAARIRHSLRPLISRGRENFLQASGPICRENAKLRANNTINYHRPPPGRPNGRPMTGSGGRSSVPEKLMIKSRGRGVLDPPPSRGMTIFVGPRRIRHCERSDLSAVAQRAKAEAIHRVARKV